MTDAAATPAPAATPGAEPKRKSKAPLIGLVLGLVLGGASFGAIYTEMFDPMALLGGGKPKGEAAGKAAAEGGEAKAPSGEGKTAAGEAGGNFLPLEPITVSLAPDQKASHLRFTAQIEAEPGALATVEAVKPRIVDVLNNYLRAVDVAELQNPTAMPRLRAQMLRRVQLVGGDGAVRDILITEFILN